MVASRDIKAGEPIFKEAPLTFGPSESTKPLCLGCYKPVSLGESYQSFDRKRAHVKYQSQSEEIIFEPLYFDIFEKFVQF